MSTKIYTAYKLKDPAQLWDLVENTKRQGQENVKQVLRTTIEGFMAAVKTDSETYTQKLQSYGHDYKVRLEMATKLARKSYKEQAGAPHRNPFNWDVSVGFFEFEGQIYLIPYVDWSTVMVSVLEFLKEDERLIDFAYWNNTDQPDHVTDTEWEERARVWDGIYSGLLPKRLLSLEICHPDLYWYLDPEMDMLGEFYERQKREEANE